MRKPSLGSLSKALFLPAVLIISLAAVFWSSLLPVSERGRASDFYVQRGWSAWRIGDELERRGLIKSRFSFWVYANLKGQASNLQAGRYRFNPAQGVSEITRMMALGLTSRGKLTIPEGFTIRQLSQMLESRGICSSSDFLAAAEHISAWRRILPKTYNVPLSEVPGGHLLEGLLFPDTYIIDDQTSPETLISRMLTEFNRKVANNPQLRKPPAGLTQYQALILASLVESEARVDTDRPLIASVVLNRLQRQMPLQIDATLLYAKGKHQSRVSIEDTYWPSPFNTYQNPGLPPKPICNPGLASLLAAYHPAKSDFLFYVARGDGTHVFTRTFAEHKAAKEKVKAERGKS